jgi:Family of unknown function (DUF6519)
MGDYSRDTFRATNALYQLLTGDVVADQRHYVGVRLQQGVPVLDADWNELEDIRRMELRAVLRAFIGEGVPSSGDGFHIEEIGVDDDFGISAGQILLDGVEALNLAATSYRGQPLAAGLPNLTTPPAADRDDVAFLDAWEEEVGQAGTMLVDDRLVNPAIGVETARRIARRWRVRVLEGATDLSGLVREAGHSYVLLARIGRLQGLAAIRDVMITDLRRRGITLAENLKVPIDIRRGLEIVDVSRFGNMLRSLHNALFGRLRDGNLPYQVATPSDEPILLMGLQVLINRAMVGEVQAFGRNMDNADALAFLHDLYDAQDGFLDVLTDLGNQAGTAQPFIDGYRARLDGDPAASIAGLKPALDREDLIDSVIGQEAINLFLSAPGTDLPQGSVDVIYTQAASPFEQLQANTEYQFGFEVSANFISPQATEDFTIQVVLPASFGTASANPSQLSLSPPSDSAPITVTVEPSGVAAVGDLDVEAIAVRNATLRSPQPPLHLTLGTEPPVPSFFFYVGPRLDPLGRFEVPQGHLTRPQGRNVAFRLRNTSATATRMYSVTGRIVPTVANTTGWAPLADTAVAGSPFTVTPGSDLDVNVRIDGPKPPAVAPAIGTVGDIVAIATLVQENGAPPVNPPPPVSITLPFVVIA